tara:strand:- start:1088 stop:1711 length:624 start_codon:yes stop_codon:yes gene_type:complete
VYSVKAISQVSGLLLAGGQARRMGGADKGLLTLGGQPLVAWGLKRLAGQVGEVMISANRNHTHYEKLGVSVISDGVSGYAGPLAGMMAGFEKSSHEWILSAPCDSPLLAKDYAARMYAAGTSGEFDAVVAHDGKRLQPVFMMLNRRSQSRLEAFLAGGGRKIDLWLEEISHARVNFSDHGEMFLNVNTPEDLEKMESRISDNSRSPE